MTKTVSLSTLPERLHPVMFDNHEYVDDGIDYQTYNGLWPDDEYDGENGDKQDWLWMAERQDERLRQRIGLEVVLKLSEYSCRLVTVPIQVPPFRFLDNPR